MFSIGCLGFFMSVLCWPLYYRVDIFSLFFSIWSTALGNVHKKGLCLCPIVDIFIGPFSMFFMLLFFSYFIFIEVMASLFFFLSFIFFFHHSLQKSRRFFFCFLFCFSVRPIISKGKVAVLKLILFAIYIFMVLL
jgi:hypothetical protein